MSTPLHKREAPNSRLSGDGSAFVSDPLHILAYAYRVA